MRRITETEWNDLIRAGACSGKPINEWCHENGIEKSVFYRHCRELGYISGGKRTEKWFSCINSGNKGIKDEIEKQVLVPVPLQAVYAVSHESAVPDPITSPEIRIQISSMNVFVKDGFRMETLRSVLEAITDAQRS